MRFAAISTFAAFVFGAGLAAAPSLSPAADFPTTAPGAGMERAPAADVERVATVGMTDGLRFSPGTIVIRAGDTVLWQNTSGVPHTVTADPDRASDPANVVLPPGAGTFHSGLLEPGEEFQHTFTVPGEYRYFCVPHEGAGMVGTVIVEP